MTSDECMLVDELCCELLRSDSVGSSYSTDTSVADPTDGPCWEPASCADSPFASTAACACPATISSAIAAGLIGRGGDTEAAAAALGELFPSAKSLLVFLPGAAGGGSLAALPARPGAAQAACSAAFSLELTAPMQPAIGASAVCTLTAAGPLSLAESQLAAAFAAGLGQALGQALKEQQEADFNLLSTALRSSRSSRSTVAHNPGSNSPAGLHCGPSAAVNLVPAASIAKQA